MKKFLLFFLFCFNFVALKADPIDDLAKLFPEKAEKLKAHWARKTIDLSEAGSLPEGFKDAFAPLAGEVMNLNLSGNSLTEAPDVSQCVKLRELNLSHNNLTVVPDVSDCSKLQKLNVSHNRLAEIPPAYLPRSLKFFDVSENFLTENPTSPFAAKDKKITIYNLRFIYGVQVYMVERVAAFFPARATQILEEWRAEKKLDFSGSGALPSAFWDALKPLKSTVVTLCLRGCGLETVDKFYAHDYAALKHLDISENHLLEAPHVVEGRAVVMEGQTFPIDAVIDLFPADFQTEKRAEMRKSWRDDRRVNLNDYGTLPDGFWDALNKFAPDIRGLYLQGCALDHVPDLSLYVNLSALNFAGNNFATLPDLSKCPKLSWVNFSNMGLSDVSALSNLQHLRKVFLRKNQLTMIPELSDRLELLYFDDNPLVEAPDLSRYVRLEELSLERTGLKVVPDFSNNKYLKGVWLKENHLLKKPATPDKCRLDFGKQVLLIDNLAEVFPDRATKILEDWKEKKIDLNGFGALPKDFWRVFRFLQGEVEVLLLDGCDLDDGCDFAACTKLQTLSVENNRFLEGPKLPEGFAFESASQKFATDALAALFSEDGVRERMAAQWEEEKKIEVNNVDFPENFWTEFGPLAEEVEMLVLTECCIKEIPNVLNCANLTVLDLSKNLLKEGPDLSECSSLKELNLSYNQLAQVPDVSACEELAALDLSYNPDLQVLPQELGERELQKLMVQSCGLLVLPNALVSEVVLGALEVLNVAHNPIVWTENMRDLASVEKVIVSADQFEKGAHVLTYLNLEVAPEQVFEER